MSLTAAEVAEIVKLLEESSFDELHLEMGGVKLTLRRGQGASPGQGVNRADAGVVQGGRQGGVAGASPSTAGIEAGSAAGTQKSARAADARAAAGGASSATSFVRKPETSVATSAQPEAGVEEVRSPLLGTFYRAPKPGAEPFVKVGSVVEPDTVVAIIEVMKLMNSVRAGVRGTVTEILAEDGALVEYDEPLFRVRVTSDEAR